jgi:alpha-methylacyl-CoA racemase
LLHGLGLEGADIPGQLDMGRWEELRAAFTKAFAAQDRDHWAGVFNGTDACVTPVLSFAEVETEPHITERGTFFHDVSADGDNLEPAPAPRFSRSQPPTPTPPGEKGSDTEAVLRDWV